MSNIEKLANEFRIAIESAKKKGVLMKNNGFVVSHIIVVELLQNYWLDS